jgi:hypothetical protein
MLVGKPEGKRPLGRPRHRWEDNIRMDLRKIGWEGRVVGYCEHGDELWGCIKVVNLLSSCEIFSF